VTGSGIVIETRQFEEITRICVSREINGKPYYWVAAYLVDGLLIDTGCDRCSEEFMEYLKGRDVQLVVNTHYHEDHVGSNARIKESIGAEIYAHQEAVPLIRQPPQIAPFREFTWGLPQPSEVKALDGCVETRNFRFEVIDTPGHCRGHVALLERSRGWCFTGDLYIGERLKVAGLENDMAAMVASLRKLEKLDTDRLMLFTSLRTVLPDGRRALRKAISWFETLAQNVKALGKKGTPVPVIVDELFGGETVFLKISGGELSCANMVRLILEAQEI
jgi:glyoxylase-like metal-dependent hydrolase (beta-lactamase superfamily II)